MIQIQNLVRRYGAVEAVSGLDLTIPGGLVLGLLGVLETFDRALVAKESEAGRPGGGGRWVKRRQRD